MGGDDCAHTCKYLGMHMYILAFDFCKCVSLYVNLGVCVHKLSAHSWICLSVRVLSKLVIPVSMFLLESGLPG